MTLLTVNKSTVAPSSGIQADFQPTDRHWTSEEYYRLAELGILGEDDHVELIGGRIVQMAPQNVPHDMAISLSAKAIEKAFEQAFYARQQQPLSLAGHSEPEPDIAVVTGGPRDYPQTHPSSALLILKVSDSTLRFDRAQKASLYASAGIADYWILNLNDRLLEVRRNPLPDPAHPFGFHYGDLKTYQPDESATPLALADTGKSIRVSDLLP